MHSRHGVLPSWSPSAATWLFVLLLPVTRACPADGFNAHELKGITDEADAATTTGALPHDGTFHQSLQPGGACKRGPHLHTQSNTISKDVEDRPITAAHSFDFSSGSSDASFSASTTMFASRSRAAAADVAAAAVDEIRPRRYLQSATYPSSISNGSASATFPAATFTSWCAADTACATAGNLSLSLSFYTDASPFTSITPNWPNVFSGPGVTSLQLASGVLELNFANYASKVDQLICDTSTSNCNAVLSIPLNTSADLTKSFVCLRLETNLTGSGYQVHGYPPGSSGTSLESTGVVGAMRCTTNRFGKHIIMQYTQAAQSPPALPAPPPSLNTVGATYDYDFLLNLTVQFSLSFDTLKNNATVLTDVTTSLQSSLATNLAAAASSQLHMTYSASNKSSNSSLNSTLYRIRRATNASMTAVAAEFYVGVSAGTTGGQLQALVNILTYNTASMFAASPYASYLTSYVSVGFITPASPAGLTVRSVIAISVGCAVATMLLAAAVYGIYCWRVYAAILPKKPKGQWDATGVAATPRKAARRRMLQQEKLELAATPHDDNGLPLPPASMGGPTAEGCTRPGPQWESGALRPKSPAELLPPKKQAWG